MRLIDHLAGAKRRVRNHARAARAGYVCLAIAGVAALTTGCAHSPTQAFVDPAHAEHRYDGFLAYGAFRDLGIEGRFEKALCERLARANHACVPMLAVATPTRPQDAASRQRAAWTSGAQAIVIMELADTRTTSRRVLANGEPAYKISLVDVDSQQVVARFAIEGRDRKSSLMAKAQAVAKDTVDALDEQGLLQRR